MSARPAKCTVGNSQNNVLKGFDPQDYNELITFHVLLLHSRFAEEMCTRLNIISFFYMKIAGCFVP